MSSKHLFLLVIPALLSGCCKSTNDKTKPAKVLSPAEEQGTDALVTEASIVAFYDTWGEWRGKFKMSRITQMRIDSASPTLSVADVEYKYESLPGNATPPGVDRRSFEVAWEGGEWAVKSMGGNQSAGFEDEGWSNRGAIRDLTTFYNTRSEWAGQFTISTVTRYRIDRLSATTRRAYVGYTYEPARGNSQTGGRDYRTFSFRRDGGAWGVTGMGTHDSAAQSLNP